MDKININNLSGKCLAATPTTEGIFAKSLVYICSHNEDGAMGLIINKPLKGLSFADLSFNLPFSNCLGNRMQIFNGGPLEHEKGFILHDDSYNDILGFPISEGIRVSSSPEILQAITSGKGPDNFMIVLGYAGWLPNQLENEISQNLWLVTAASQELIFNAQPEDKWTLALSSLGINSSNLSLPLGHS